jgi:hypothetical protein
MINTVEELEEKLKETYGRTITELSNPQWHHYWYYVSDNLILSNALISEFKHQLRWGIMSERQILSEELICEFFAQVNWRDISIWQKLSEEFIRKFDSRVDWYYISASQKLSEELIREFENKVNWDNISKFQKLSENFIREFKNRVNWCLISHWQKLSEEFICEFESRVNWSSVSQCQKLSELFICKFDKRVNWYNISAHQKLSESFICEHKKKLNWKYISAHQKLSESFMHYFSSKIVPCAVINNWQIKPLSEKKELIEKYYEIINIDDIEYVKCYKAVHANYSSIYLPQQYRYDDPSKIYKTKCDYYSDNENSYGFGCWTYEYAIKIAKDAKLKEYQIITVICPIKKICVLANGKIRAEQMKIISL